MRIEGGTGSDRFEVGAGSLDDISQLSRPGLNAPFGIGPLVLVGSPRNAAGVYADTGIDALIVDDSLDADVSDEPVGSVTAFLEPRIDADGLVEVGAVTGLGMKLFGDIAAVGANTPGTGRLEFEGFESVEVKLGTDDDTFAVGGEDLLADLPPTRRDEVVEFIHTPATAMKVVDGGGGGDTIQLVSTAAATRSALNSSLNLLSVATTTQGELPDGGVGSGTEEEQTLTITAPTWGSKVLPGYFTLKYRYQETKPLPFGISAEDLEFALQALQLLTTNVTDVTLAGGVYTVEFHENLGDVEQLVATVVPLLLDGGESGGNDVLNVQSVFEETFLLGGSEPGSGPPFTGTGGDQISLNVDAITRAALTQNEITASISISTTTQGSTGVNEVQVVQLSNVTGGFYTLTFGASQPIEVPWDTPAAALEKLLEDLDGVPTSETDEENDFGVVKVGLTYTITFLGDHAGQNVVELTHDVVIATTTAGGSGANEVQQVTLQGPTDRDFTLTVNGVTTASLDWTATADAVDLALERIAGGPGDDFLVVKSGLTYTITFTGAFANTNVALLAGRATSLRSNGINAVVTVDGEGGNDKYEVNLIGGVTDSRINVFDSGTSGYDLGTATFDSDRLTVLGTDSVFKPDVFLLRAANSDSGLAFIALINAPDPHAVQPADPVERVNYSTALETITIKALAGDDEFWIDDTRSIITIEAGDGNDFFQVGQLYRSRRTPELSNVLPEDTFATIETTKGWLSNGISNPMTIYGQGGEDLFIVFHNLAVLTLNGGDDDDTFIIQAFALAGSQEDKRELTDLSGDAGADLIQYAVNAPVNINGGDGFDTVIIIGTEFGDDFVVTRLGVYGAGLNVNFINIEFLEVDGAEGDDRFFILSTGVNFTTVITGGLGTDLFSVEGPTPANGVISNDLLGHSGIITHGVESTVEASKYAGLKVVGISANVQDNDEPAIVITQSGGYSQVVEAESPDYADVLKQHIDTYTIVLARRPLFGETVTVQVVPPEGLVFLVDDLSDADTLPDNELRTTSDEVQSVRITGASGGTFTLQFRYDSNADGDFLDTDEDLTTAAIAYDANASAGSGSVQSKLVDLASIDPGDIEVKKSGSTYTISFKGKFLDKNVPELIAHDSLTPGAATVTVTTGVEGGESVPDVLNLAFTLFNWWVPREVRFTVDTLATSIPDIADIQHRVSMPLVGPASVTGRIDGVVANLPPSLSFDTSPSVEGDEYATIVASVDLPAGALPSLTLPEGLRGAYVKTTGGDEEAAGQIRLILGSFRTKLDINGGGDFTLAFGSSSVSLSTGATAAQIRAALAAFPEIGSLDNVSVRGCYAPENDPAGTCSFVIDLKGELVLTDAVKFAVTSGAASATIDRRALKLNKPWSVQPSPSALFEIGLFGAVQLPNVRVRVYSSDLPEVVVDQSEGSTTVAEGTTVTAAADPAEDSIRIRLSRQPQAGETVTVGLGGAGQLEYSLSAAFGSLVTSVSFTNAAGSWDAFTTVYVRAKQDGVVEGFHKADLTLAPTSSGVGTPTAYGGFLAVADVADDDFEGVRVLESEGSTNVVEFQSLQCFFCPLPAVFADSYSVLLTKAPAAGEVVTITVRAEPTRTSRTGGIRSFAEQVLVCVALSGVDCTNPANYAFDKPVSFNADGSGGNVKWDVPVTVHVRAFDDKRVDGQDTQVFAPQLDLLNNIQGPLFIRGGLGEDRTGLLEREPVMLPRGGSRPDLFPGKPEVNLKPSMGIVIAATETPPDAAATITIDASTLGTIDVSEFRPGGGGDNEIQEIAVSATSGTFTLTFGGATTAPIRFNASALDLELALEALDADDAFDDDDFKVSKNSSVFKVEFIGDHADTAVADFTFDDGLLGPTSPSELVDFTIEITAGPAKNKVRIVAATQDLGSQQWKLTLNKPWFSPFTRDSSIPLNEDANDNGVLDPGEDTNGNGVLDVSEYTLEVTNPNLLVKEETQTDILWVFDSDNPGSFNDPAHPDVATSGNPFAQGQLFHETTKFGESISISTVTNGGAGGNSEVQKLTKRAVAGDLQADLRRPRVDRPERRHTERDRPPGRDPGAHRRARARHGQRQRRCDSVGRRRRLRDHVRGRARGRGRAEAQGEHDGNHRRRHAARQVPHHGVRHADEPPDRRCAAAGRDHLRRDRGPRDHARRGQQPLHDRDHPARHADDAQHRRRQRRRVRQGARRRHQVRRDGGAGLGPHVRQPRRGQRHDHGHRRRSHARRPVRDAHRHGRPAAGKCRHARQGLARRGDDRQRGRRDPAAHHRGDRRHLHGHPLERRRRRRGGGCRRDVHVGRDRLQRHGGGL